MSFIQCCKEWLIPLLPPFVGSVILIVTIAFLVPAWHKINMARKFPQPPWPPPSDKQLPFHQAEFSALKAEVAELIKSVSANFRYAALGSIGVITWIITEIPKSRLNAAPLLIGLWLPFILASFLASLSAAQYARLAEMAIYLFRLERGLSAASLGWEDFFRTRVHTVGAVYIIGWVTLIVADVVVGAFGTGMLGLLSSLPAAEFIGAYS